MAEAHLGLDDPEGALGALAATDLAVGAPRLHVATLRAEAHLRMGAADRALLLLAPLERSIRETGTGLLLFAEALLEEGKVERAENLLVELEKRDPGAALPRLGVLHYERGDHEACVRILGRVIRRNREDYYSRIYAARSLVELGRPEEAERVLGEARRLAETPEVRYLLGRAAARRDRHHDAAVHFRAALKSEPEYTEAVYGLALSLRRTGKSAEARRQLGRFRELHRRDWKYQQEANRLEEECRRRPRDARAALTTARSHFAARQFDRASRFAWLALRRDPALLDARLMLARALERQGRRAESALHYQKILRRDGRHPEARAELEALIRGHGREAPRPPEGRGGGRP